MTTNKYRAWGFTPLVASMLFALGGCVRESTVNGERVYQYELWVPSTVVLAGLVAIPIGLALRKKTARIGWGLIVAGPLAIVGFAPSLFRERVIVSADRFDVRSGIWGLTAANSARFAEILTIRITAEKTATRRGQRTNYYLNCDHKSGGSNKVPINNAVTQAAAEEIFRQAKAHGIPILDQAGDQ